MVGHEEDNDKGNNNGEFNKNNSTKNNVKPRVYSRKQFLSLFGAGLLVGGFGGYEFGKPDIDLEKALADLEKLRKKNESLKARLKELSGAKQSLEERLNAFKNSNLDDIVVENRIYEYDFTDYFNKWENRGAEKIYPFILKAIEKHKDVYWVDPMLVLAIIKKESSNGHNLISMVGAVGAFQLMPLTAEYPEEMGSARNHEEANELIAESIRKGKKPYLRVWKGQSFESAKKYDDEQRKLVRRINLYRGRIANIIKHFEDRIENKDFDSFIKWLKKVHPRTAGELNNLIKKEQTARIRYFSARKKEEEWNNKYLDELKIMRFMRADGMKEYFDERMDYEKAADASVLYLAHLCRTCEGNVVRILSMYNSGEMIIPEYDETRNYVDEIINNYVIGVRLYRKK